MLGAESRLCSFVLVNLRWLGSQCNYYRKIRAVASLVLLEPWVGGSGDLVGAGGEAAGCRCSQRVGMRLQCWCLLFCVCPADFGLEKWPGPWRGLLLQKNPM